MSPVGRMYSKMSILEGISCVPYNFTHGHFPAGQTLKFLFIWLQQERWLSTALWESTVYVLDNYKTKHENRHSLNHSENPVGHLVPPADNWSICSQPVPTSAFTSQPGKASLHLSWAHCITVSFALLSFILLLLPLKTPQGKSSYTYIQGMYFCCSHTVPHPWHSQGQVRQGTAFSWPLSRHNSAQFQVRRFPEHHMFSNTYRPAAPACPYFRTERTLERVLSISIHSSPAWVSCFFCRLMKIIVREIFSHFFH